MKRLILYFIIITNLFGSVDLWSQQDKEVEIKGIVSSNPYQEIVGIRDATILVNQKDSLVAWTLSNAEGKYSLKLKKSLGAVSLKLTTTKHTTDKYHSGYLSSRESYKINLNDSSAFTLNFYPTYITHCYTLPVVLFKVNSCEPINPIEDTISFFFEEIKQEPNTIFCVNGYCDSKELKKDSLSQARAEYIKQLLVKRGVNEKRLKTKGYSSERQIVKDDFIKKARSTAEKEALHQKNRRVTLSLISWDFKE